MNELHSVLSDEVRAEEAVGEDELIEADDLIEEVSIDGMCGVY
jgi:mycofactocin precursor